MQTTPSKLPPAPRSGAKARLHLLLNLHTAVQQWRADTWLLMSTEEVLRAAARAAAKAAAANLTTYFADDNHAPAHGADVGKPPLCSCVSAPAGSAVLQCAVPAHIAQRRAPHRSLLC